jgi:hypothetical protein
VGSPSCRSSHRFDCLNCPVTTRYVTGGQARTFPFGVSRLLWSLIAGFWCPGTRRPAWADGVTRQSSVGRFFILLRPGAASLTPPAIWGSASSRSTLGAVKTALTAGWPGPDQRREGRAGSGQAADGRTGGRTGHSPLGQRAARRCDAPRRFEAIAVMASEGLPVQVATRVLGVSESGYYEWRGRVSRAP